MIHNGRALWIYHLPRLPTLPQYGLPHVSTINVTICWNQLLGYGIIKSNSLSIQALFEYSLLFLQNSVFLFP